MALSKSTLEERIREKDKDEKALNWDVNFDDLEESRSEKFKRNFKDAWKVLMWRVNLASYNNKTLLAYILQ